MPTPIYIIVSNSCSTDKYTGMYSVFEIVEKITLRDAKPEDGSNLVFIERQNLVVSSLWMIDKKNGENYDDEFEIQLIASMLGGKELLRQSSKFKFRGDDQPAYRMSFMLHGPLPSIQPGTLIFECRVKKTGDSHSWKSHSYQVVVEKK